jgi:hypothetical protein
MKKIIKLIYWLLERQYTSEADCDKMCMLISRAATKKITF